MGNIMPTCAGAVAVLPTGKNMAYAGGVVSNTRLPTDPLFYSNITLQNITIGSRYWIAQLSDLSNVLATGLAGASDVTIENVPVYSNPMLVEVRVRSSSGNPKYIPLVTYGYLGRYGASVYIAQVEDAYAN